MADAHPRPDPSRRVLRGVLRLVPVVGLVAWQLAVAGPAHAQAGSLDASFGSGGKVTTDFAGSFDQANALAVQGDGRLVAAGSARFGTSDDFALARYNPDGSLDASFGSGGKVTTDFAAGHDVATALAVQADGKLVAAGYSLDFFGTPLGFALARYHPDGSLDASFGSGGKVLTGGLDRANALAVQGDGRLVAAGVARSGSIDFALVRYQPDGALDASFGDGGKVLTDFAGGPDRANALVVQADGRLVAAGNSLDSSATPLGFALARYHPDGSLDASFGSGGKVTTSGLGRANALVVQGDGKLVAAGVARSSVFGLARYHPDGSLDASFGDGGTVTTSFGGSAAFPFALAVQADGKLVAAGQAYPDVGSDFALARYVEGVANRLTSLNPARIWVGLKNSDDVGVRFDLLAEVRKDGVLVGSGQLNSVAAGSSGFNNAKLDTIPFSSFSPVDVPAGSQLSLKLSVRNACSGSRHNSGVARLWFNDSVANSRFGATIGATTSDYFLRDGFLLAPTAGPGPKKTVDVQAGAKCSPFKPFGTWSITL
jgi:uncharacterized delta-60 repeat protein